MEKERELPEIQIEGTTFLVDVQRNMLREKSDPDNELKLFYMNVGVKGFGFSYDKKIRGFAHLDTLPDDRVYVRINPLVELDPVGLAEKYGYTVEQIKGKTDFEVMVDQDALAKRLHGLLPTVDIAGDIFYVDFNMKTLRLKDDFSSDGITFKELDKFSCIFEKDFVFHYDPKKHEIREPDYKTITEVPQDLIPIYLPPLRQLDPVAYARQSGTDLHACLMQYGIQLEHKAKVLTWQQSGVNASIKRNLALQGEKKRPNKKKGRGL